MDFSNFAGIEFARAIEAEREHDRKQRTWLFLWKDLRRAADEREKAGRGGDEGEAPRAAA